MEVIRSVIRFGKSVTMSVSGGGCFWVQIPTLISSEFFTVTDAVTDTD